MARERNEQGGAESLGDCSLSLRDGKVILGMAPGLAALVNEGVMRDLKLLAGHLGVEAVWEVAGEEPRRAVNAK